MKIVGLPRLPLVALAAALLAAGCGTPAEESPGVGAAPPESAGVRVTVYSGRSESLVGPLLERFGEREGLEIKVRYGGTAELAATVMEEGGRTPADLFVSQDAAALGALSDAGLLRPLPEDLLARVPRRFRSPRGDWVGLSGRARAVVYNTGLVEPEALPQSLEQVVEPRYRGRFGVAPTNGSFQAHMAVYRVVEGPEALERLLAGMAANEPLRYPSNRAIVEAVLAGEVEWGLTNHYYLWRALEERPGAPGANFFQSEGAASGFVNVAGAGLLSDSQGARRLVELLLSEEAQRYFADETFEYPLAAGVAPAPGLPPIDQLATPEVDFGQASAVLAETLEAIGSSGLVE